MAGEVVGAVFEVECGNPTQKLVLVALAEHTDKFKAECWPSVTRLMKRCELCRQAVVHHLGELERKRLIVVTRKPGMSNRYSLKPVYHVDHHQSTKQTAPVYHVDPIRQEPSVQPSRGRKPPLFRGAERVSADKEVDRIIQLQRAFKANHPVPWNSAEKAEWAEMVDRKSYLKAGLGAKY